MVVSPRALDPLASHPTARAPTTSTSPGPTPPSRCAGASRRCASARDRRRRLRPGPPGRLDRARTPGSAARRSSSIFNPKGGVGKTTVATNLASALQVRQGQQVLLARRRHGHRPRHDVARPRAGPDGRRQLARPARGRAGRDAHRDLAAAHPSGMRVVALTSSPLNTEILDPNAWPTRSRPPGGASTSSSSTSIRRTAR